MQLTEILALLAGLVAEPDQPDRFESYAASGAAPAYPITVQPCPTPLGRNEIEGETIICGTVSVPERHADPDGARIDLFFAVLRAWSMYPDPDPMLHLHGGPGGGVVSRNEMFASIFEPVRRTRDVVLFDQRAAVLSARSTTCRAALDRSLSDVLSGKFAFTDNTEEGLDERPAPVLRDCVAELEAMGTDLSAYNTVENANDAVALMKALGYPQYNVHGISYGTRLTLEILRSHPQHVRSAVIDGVAPLQVALYDTLAQPASEAMDILVDQCAQDERCNEAFPDFRDVLRRTLDQSISGELTLSDGTPVTLETVIGPMFFRNGTYARPSAATSYYPAFIYELANLDRETPTPILELMNSSDGVPEHPSPLEAVRKSLLDSEALALERAKQSAEIADLANASLDVSIDRLRQKLSSNKVPLAQVFDDEMVRNAGNLLEDAEATRAALLAYARLRESAPNPDALRSYVIETFAEENQSRLLGLIDAMSATEVEAVFSNVDQGVSALLKGVTSDLHLWIYACQESIPHNSINGFRETSAELSWPQFAELYEEAAQSFFSACEAFEPVAHPGLHDPVVSDIPVLSIGSSWDVQTAPSWPALAAETLSNAQTFLIPEAGHGAIAYQDCVADMLVAFLDDPSKELSERCPRSIRPTFYAP